MQSWYESRGLALDITRSCRAVKNNIEVLANMQMVDPPWTVGEETSNMIIIFLHDPPDHGDTLYHPSTHQTLD